ncbi:MAG: ribosome-binding factor A [Patescibacteria group bacterium]
MTSTRQKQVNSLLQEELSMYWEREVELPKNTLLTVARVEATGPLDKAYVYVSIWPEDKQKEVMEVLKKQIYSTQKYIDKRLSMRRVPQIILEVDEQSASRREVEDVLDSLEE